MGNIREFLSVPCPFDTVPERLIAACGGVNAVLPLCVKVGDLRIERDVDVRFTPREGFTGYRFVDLTWTPHGGGPYPTFTGTLSAAEDAVGWSRVELYGTYRPPFGLAGTAFDLAIGERIAHAVAIELLAEIKRLLSAAAVPTT